MTTKRIGAALASLGLALLIFAGLPLHAFGAVVQLQAQIVATCGGAAVGNVNGFGYITMDQNGNWCSNVTGGGGGGSAGPVSLPAGSVAAGAYLAGSLLDGADTTLGTKADAAYTGSGSATGISVLKGIYNQVGLPLAAQSGHTVDIGAVDQEGTWSVGLTGTLPAFASTPAFTISGTLPAFASTPAFNLSQYGGSAVGSGNPVYVDVTNGAAAPPNDVTTGPTTCTTTTTCNALTVSTQGSGSVGAIVTGSGAGMTFTMQGSVDGTNFVNIPYYTNGVPVASGATQNSNATFEACPAGYKSFRLFWTALTSGTVTETLNSSAGSCPIPITTGGGQAIDIVAFGNTAVTLGQKVAASSIPVVLPAATTVEVVGAAAGGAAVSGNPVLIGGSDGTDARTISTDAGGRSIPGQNCTGVINIAQTATTDVHTSTAKLHICSIVLISATAQNIGIDEGTGTTCESSGTALLGVSSTSAATAQMAVGANGGFSAISGVPWLQTGTTGDHLCVVQSSSGEVAGTITYSDY